MVEHGGILEHFETILSFGGTASTTRAPILKIPRASIFWALCITLALIEQRRLVELVGARACDLLVPTRNRRKSLPTISLHISARVVQKYECKEQAKLHKTCSSPSFSFPYTELRYCTLRSPAKNRGTLENLRPGLAQGQTKQNLIIYSVDPRGVSHGRRLNYVHTNNPIFYSPTQGSAWLFSLP